MSIFHRIFSLLGLFEGMGVDPRRLLSLAAAVIMGVTIGCDDAPGTTAPARVTWLVDGDNFGDGRDLHARIAPAMDEQSIAEYRVVVIAAQDAGAFDVTAALEAAPSSYLVVPVSGESVDIAFGPNATDANGDLVADSGSYALVVVSVSQSLDVESSLSAASAPVTLAVTDLIKTLTESIDAGSGGMDVDAAGNIYSADFGASLSGPPGTRVHKITPDGDVSVFAEGLLGASGNAFDSNGDLFQSNISAGLVSRITPDGTVSPFASEGLRGPVGIAIDADDSLHVVNCSDNTIQKITADGVSTRFADSPLLNCPNGITLASDDYFYVANFGNGNVLRVNQNGNVSEFVTIPGQNNGHILFGNGVLYVVARADNQLYQVTLDGEITLLAGTGTRGLRDGAARTATLSLTNDVALSPDGGILYFNDVASISGGTQVISPVVIRMLIFAD